jgi:hypothetical protein
MRLKRGMTVLAKASTSLTYRPTISSYSRELLDFNRCELLFLEAGSWGRYRPLPPGRFLVLISVRGCLDSRALVRLERLDQLKNPVTSSGIEPTTFRLAAQGLNQLRYRMLLPYFNFISRSLLYDSLTKTLGWLEHSHSFISQGNGWLNRR